MLPSPQPALGALLADENLTVSRDARSVTSAVPRDRHSPQTVMQLFSHPQIPRKSPSSMTRTRRTSERWRRRFSNSRESKGSHTSPKSGMPRLVIRSPSTSRASRRSPARFHRSLGLQGPDSALGQRLLEGLGMRLHLLLQLQPYQCWDQQRCRTNAHGRAVRRGPGRRAPAQT